jgi:hypothetical protein
MVLTCGAVIGLLMILWVEGPTEPASLLPAEKGEATYRGQPTSYWLTQLKSGDVSFRVMATQAIQLIGPQDEHIVLALAETLQDPNAEVRRAAAFALWRLGSVAKPAVSSLIHGLKDQDPLVRITAACALGSIQPSYEGIVAALTPMLQDDNSNVRRTILRILRAMDSAATTVSPTVRKALMDMHAETYREASELQPGAGRRR